jgi:hypothetical protein
MWSENRTRFQRIANEYDTRRDRKYGMVKEAIYYAYFHPKTQIFVLCATLEDVNKIIEYVPKVLKAFSMGHSIVDFHTIRKHIDFDNESRIIVGLTDGLSGERGRIE